MNLRVNSTLRSTLLCAGIGVLVLVLIWAGVRFGRDVFQSKSVDESKLLDALDARAAEIAERCGGSPREVRRFLNMVRLVGIPSDEHKGSEKGGTGTGEMFSEHYQLLVGLAIDGAGSELANENPKLTEAFVERCRLFGFPEGGFLPKPALVDAH